MLATWLSVSAQQLSVEETIDYINRQAIKYNLFSSLDEKFDSLTIHISGRGYITISTCVHEFRLEKDTGTIFGTKASRFYLWHDHFKFDYRKVRVEKSGQNITFISKNNSIQDDDATTNFKNLSIAFDIEGVDKIVNAFDYLFSVLKYDKSYNEEDSDPFSTNNYGKTKNGLNKSTKESQAIKLRSDNGLYKIKIAVCGMLTELILDTGASDVSISSEIEKKLLEKGLINKSNYLTPGLYKLADGSIVTNRRLIIPSIKIGSFTVKNVAGSISPSNDGLLLGKSLLNQFSKWTIDNNNQILLLQK